MRTYTYMYLHMSQVYTTVNTMMAGAMKKRAEMTRIKNVFALVLFTYTCCTTTAHSQHLAKAIEPYHNLHPTKHQSHWHDRIHVHAEAVRRSQSFSVVIDPLKPHLNSFVRIANPLVPFTNGLRAHVEYSCQEGDLVAVQLFLHSDDLTENLTRFFHYDWTCNKYSSGTQKTFVQLTVPDWLDKRPDYLHRDAINVDSLELKVWILNRRLIPTCVRLDNLNCYDRAHVKGVYLLEMSPVYQRPRRRYDANVCLAWDRRIMLNYMYASEEEVLRCMCEEELVQLVDFPVALSGLHSGITKSLSPFLDSRLIRMQQKNNLSPKFTISTMIYLLEYCETNLCGIIHRKSISTNEYITPLLFLTNKGLIHIQAVLENGQASGMLSNYRIPLRQWVRLVYRQDGSKWTLKVSSEQNLTQVVVSDSVFANPVRYDESEGNIHIGGSSTIRAFKGYIADTWLWRTKAIEKVPNWNYTNAILMEKIHTYITRCENLRDGMWPIYEMYLSRRSVLLAQMTCANSYLYHLDHSSSSQSELQVCWPWERRAPGGHRHLWKALKTIAWRNQPYRARWDTIGKMLHDWATKYLASLEGLSRIPTIRNLLHQASCYGSSESSYMLGTLYIGGVNLDKDQNQAYLYWLVAAQTGNRLAMMALANHHYHGLDVAPQDFDFSYNYLKVLADFTVKDRERHDPHGVLTEFVRLTDAASLQVHKGEDSDHFLWLKFQAKKGMAQAQLDMARILFWGLRGIERDVQQAVDLYHLYLMDNPLDEVALYDFGIIHLKATIARLKFWGSEGVKRDMKTAVKYYETSAREMPLNRVALYDYGIVLLRGQGTKKNVEKALEHLNKSAELGHAPAYTALGWYAINFQRDMKLAAKYFDIADSMGHRDAMHNLGYMYKSGRYPGKPADESKAMWYFQKAANRGHIDSAGVVADMYSQGSGGVQRSSYKAVSWSLYVCEQNPEIGMALRKGLDAYLATSWGESIVRYMMVAETGLEVAQFNLAYLCEEDLDGLVTKYLRADCMWKYYNLSSHAAKPHVISQLKMGDFYYYGYHGLINWRMAVQYYAMAAKRHEAQALFNLACLVEEGADIDDTVWKSLYIPNTIYNAPNRSALVTTLYRRCLDWGGKDSFFPCGLALLRVQLLTLWGKHTLAIQISSAFILGLVIIYLITSFVGYVTRPEQHGQQHDNAPAVLTASGQSTQETLED